ncbi:hypothetical protein D3C80_1791600 [compost metagenome]
MAVKGQQVAAGEQVLEQLVLHAADAGLFDRQARVVLGAVFTGAADALGNAPGLGRIEPRQGLRGRLGPGHQCARLLQRSQIVVEYGVHATALFRRSRCGERCRPNPAS